MLSVAYAQAATQQGSPIPSIAFIALMIGAFYFMIIRPQQKRAKELRALVSNIKVGDEVMTSTGMLGKIHKLGDVYIDLEIANNVVVKMQKQTIINILPKGSLKD